MREISGRRLIDHVIERLTPQVSAIVLNANGDPSRFGEFGFPVLPDNLPDYPGPLAGVLAALDWGAEYGVSHVVSVAADTPFFPLDLVEALKKAAGPEGLALAANPDETSHVQRQPTFGLWPVALRRDLRAALEGGLRKIVLWTDQHQAGQAVFSAAYDPFFNVNTPEDLAAAEAIAKTLE